MFDNRKCLTTANVWQLKISRNGQCLLALYCKVSHNCKCKCLKTESVWQQKVSWQQQKSHNWKYLATDNVFQPYAWKCLVTANVFTDNVWTDLVLHLKVSGNRKCHFGSKRTLSRNGRLFVTESVGKTKKRNIWKVCVVCGTSLFYKDNVIEGLCGLCDSLY